MSFEDLENHDSSERKTKKSQQQKTKTLDEIDERQTVLRFNEITNFKIEITDTVHLCFFSLNLPQFHCEYKCECRRRIDTNLAQLQSKRNEM